MEPTNEQKIKALVESSESLTRQDARLLLGLKEEKPEDIFNDIFGDDVAAEFLKGFDNPEHAS